MIKILYVATGGLHRDGITLSQLDNINNMNLNGIEMHIAAVYNNDESVIKEFENNNCIVKKFCNRKKYIFKYIFQLYKYIKKEQFDIIHVCGSSSLMIIELFIAKICGVKVRIAHGHNTVNSHKIFDVLMKPLFNCMYTNAWACGEDAGRFVFGNKKFEIIHNGRDLSKYKFNEENRKFYRNKLNFKDFIIIGHVGSFSYQKNQEFIVKIAKLTDKSKYKFCLVGDGPELDKIYEMCKSNNLLDRIIFIGKINYVNELLSAFDVMILPSRFEGLPMVLTEWQANGLPCIISDKVTKEANIGLNVINLGIDEENINEWINKIYDINITNRKELSECNIERLIEKGFDIESCSNKLRNMYFDLYNK